MNNNTVTLCGSTRFKNHFLKVAEKLTLEGKIVLMPCVFGHADKFKWSKEQKKNLDELHLRKIDMSDEIYVININNYIGKSTREEISYALLKGKKISYYEDSWREDGR